MASRLNRRQFVGRTAALAGLEASYITGQQIVLDGGQILPESLEAIEEI